MVEKSSSSATAEARIESARWSSSGMINVVTEARSSQSKPNQ